MLCFGAITGRGSSKLKWKNILWVWEAGDKLKKPIQKLIMQFQNKNWVWE